MLRCELDKLAQPLEIVLPLSRFVIAPGQASPPGGQPQFLHQPEVLCHLLQIFPLDVILQDAE